MTVSLSNPITRRNLFAAMGAAWVASRGAGEPTRTRPFDAAEGLMPFTSGPAPFLIRPAVPRSGRWMAVAAGTSKNQAILLECPPGSGSFRELWRPDVSPAFVRSIDADDECGVAWLVECADRSNGGSHFRLARQRSDESPIDWILNLEALLPPEIPAKQLRRAELLQDARSGLTVLAVPAHGVFFLDPNRTRLDHHIDFDIGAELSCLHHGQDGRMVLACSHPASSEQWYSIEAGARAFPVAAPMPGLDPGARTVLGSQHGQYIARNETRGTFEWHEQGAEAARGQIPVSDEHAWRRPARFLDENHLLLESVTARPQGSTERAGIELLVWSLPGSRGRETTATERKG